MCGRFAMNKEPSIVWSSRNIPLDVPVEVAGWLLNQSTHSATSSSLTPRSRSLVMGKIVRNALRVTLAWRQRSLMNSSVIRSV